MTNCDTIKASEALNQLNARHASKFGAGSRFLLTTLSVFGAATRAALTRFLLDNNNNKQFM